MTQFSIKPPDMSRNMALAGKTVSTRGRNITYDEQGYAVSATNYSSRIYAGTEKSIRAPSVDAVLAGAERDSLGGSVYDRQHFSDRELAHAAELREQAASGQLSAEEADRCIEDIREMYGYSGGASGTEYLALGHGRTFHVQEQETPDYQKELQQRQEQQFLLGGLRVSDGRDAALGLLEELDDKKEDAT